ncbi:hypothetical protein BDK92_3674 [Micromonospora pisi]|uniref:Uncharacterized protein n=1 Tax=Micromonospora pisi TaxID=589240 RepID=A0A495JJT9_9ACTN|nr:hypothetical protein [Micromonospora pisi]RKR89330.1 hypothetical protein BDK92_3674 [Micromonospora pisi]
MTGNLAEVVQQFRRVINELDQAAITAKAAQEHAEAANARYIEVGKGTDHPDINHAKYESQTAGQKAGRVARLLSEATKAFTEYANTIAPGSIPPSMSSQGAMPDGEQVLDTPHQGSMSSRLLGRAGATPNAEDGLQHAKKLGNAIQDATRPSGTAAPKQATPAFVKSQGSQGAQAGDALLAALTLAVMGIKGAELAARLRRKTKANNNRKDGSESNG